MYMRRTLLLAASSALLLSACGRPATAVSVSLEQRLANPLFAEYYFDDLVERLVDLDIQNDASLEDAGIKNAADAARREGLQAAKNATKKQNEGVQGMMIPGKDFAQGEVLIVDDMLYFHPQFIATPGVDVRIYLSEALDPRDGDFPDASAVEVGPLQSPYGDQSYALQPSAEGERPAFRSLVLWDAALERLSGFAQLRMP